MLRIQMQLLSRDTNDCVSTCFSTRSWSYHRARHELITPGLTSLYLSENSLRQQHESNLDVPYFGFLTQLNVPIPPIPIVVVWQNHSRVVEGTRLSLEGVYSGFS